LGDYFTRLTIPANTPEDAPAQTQIKIEGEVLAEIAYLLPEGWHCEPSFAVFYGIRQIYPEAGSDWVTGDRLYRKVPLGWTLPETPCMLTVKGVSPGTSYPHTVYLWLLTKPVAEARPWKVLADFIAILKRLLGLR